MLLKQGAGPDELEHAATLLLIAAVHSQPLRVHVFMQGGTTARGLAPQGKAAPLFERID